MRVTITIKGELEEYVKEEMARSDEPAGTVCKMLCDQGMEYKRGLKTMAAFAAAIQGGNGLNPENIVTK